ncbi:hypothetical protein NR798_17555 [Archangium gephyra]|uniref:hypothetical protein n=1 Tax=Archangium gephyra TaxID=48 RepID=UPI0035D4A483
MALLLVLLATCGTAQGAGGAGASPSPGVQPATKKELPWLTVPGGRMKTTLFYGPWQCRQQFMRSCQQECAQKGHQLMGCMWLADLKLDWEGSLVALPVPVKAGSRYGIWHCCCDYPELSKEKNETQRAQWDGFRDSFRDDWSKRFGKWPLENGDNWPGHHIHDLKHGGNPIDPNNIIPAQPGVHKAFNKAYPACYSGQPPWNTAGPDLPYTDT